jgi:ABC-type multidrug transport system fused ATPase/permease subunit
MPLASLTNLYTSGQGAIAAAGRLDDIFAIVPERQPGASVPAPAHGAVSIALKGVTYRYPGTPDDQAVLEDLELTIEPGEWVGIVGPSGAGKTTIAGLIMGLFSPVQGQLLLNGKPYSEWEIADLRSHMAFVAQDPVLYDMSLADNIRFGLATASVEDIRRAAEQAGVLEFSDRLTEGLDSICGERGVKLSGGQKQRISLARAFLRNPGILILDEPTSAMDAASEQAIQNSLRELMADRTALVIAHRFSLVRDLDKIVVVSEGKIAEIGDHQSLMASNGIYKHLYSLQHGTATIP